LIEEVVRRQPANTDWFSMPIYDFVEQLINPEKQKSKTPDQYTELDHFFVFAT